MNARDPRRRFNAAQARYLFERAAGRCEDCGSPLGNEWPAHHVLEHAKGGPTEVWNGRALCPECHKRTHMTNDFQPRAWQLECFGTFRFVVLEDGKDLFAFEACMGAGKSTMAAMMARAILRDDDFEAKLGSVDHVLVLVPFSSIRGTLHGPSGPTGMCEDFLRQRLTVRDHFLVTGIRASQPIPKAFDASIITYQAALNPEVLKTIDLWKRDGWRFALIVDEIHHTTTTGGAWGEAVRQLRPLANVTIRMTGTDFRSDGLPSELTNYKDGRVVSHYRYLYRQGMIDQAVRPVAFRCKDATYDVTDVDTGITKTVRLSDAESKGEMQAARQVFATDGKLIGEMIQEAHDHLMRTRVRFKNAACLFVARPGSEDDEDRYVVQLAARVRAITGHEPTVLTCHDPEDVSADKLARFITGTDPYVVAVNKLSEGANIPRIRQVVFCRYTESELLFRQLVGRALRVMAGDDGTAALILIAAFPKMVGYSVNMEGEVELAFKDLRCPECGLYPCSCLCFECKQLPCVCEHQQLPPESSPPQYVPSNITVEGGGGILSGNDVHEGFIDQARGISGQMPSFAHFNPVQMGWLLQVNAAGASAPQPTRPVNIRAEAEREHFAAVINKKITILANTKYAREENPYATAYRKEFEEVHKIKFKEAKEQWSTERLEKEAERLTVAAATAKRKATGR